MTLMLDIYIEEVVRDEIQHKVEDEYSAVFDEAKEIGGGILLTNVLNIT